MSHHWFSFSVTDVGKKRSINQDAIYVNDEAGVWVVADGMGGHRDGEKASQAIVATFGKMQFSDVMSERLVDIEQALRGLNSQLQHYSTNELNGQHIGSTLMLFTVCQGVCAILWAGDSRCYRLTKNELEQVSWDHSYVDEMLRSGHLVEEEAAASKLSNIITRAVGAHSELFFDHLLVPYSDDFTYLLCSDGLTNELSNDAIFQAVSEPLCSQINLNILLEKTLLHGAKDNVSIILLSIRKRRPSNQAENVLLSENSKRLNTVADDLFNRHITLDEYYPRMSSAIDRAVANHAQFKGQPILNNDTTPQEIELPTANYPKLDQDDVFKAEGQPSPSHTVKSSVDLQYTLLIIAIAGLSAFLLYSLLF